MNLNIVCTSKPVDGLLYYSYEYCSYLNSLGISAKLVIICHRHFSKDTYISAINEKYIHCENLIFDDITPSDDDITLVMGRSMITLSWINFKSYSSTQQDSLRRLFSNNIIAVYSENQPIEYPSAVYFYAPKRIIDLCDFEVYPNGVGQHFEKTINFDIYKPKVNNIQFEHLFNGTCPKYYEFAGKHLAEFPDHGILVYKERYINPKYNNIFAPVKNLLGLFNTYVYTKETFDPAPRIIQECKYFEKQMVYKRDPAIVDGGSVYWQRPLKKLNVDPILSAIDQISKAKKFVD